MKVRVYITLKDGVLDPQGKAVEHSLAALGFTDVQDLRIGRLVELTFTGSPLVSKARVEAMCQQLLANPVIEKYSIELDGKPQ